MTILDCIRIIIVRESASTEIDERINKMTNVELLEYIDIALNSEMIMNGE